MEKEFIPYELSLELKELGFDEPCLGNYRLPTNRLITEWEIKNTPENCLGIYAPTFSQAFRWFREKYNISSFVKREFKDTKMTGYYHGIEDTEKDFYSKTYITYEEAELECLKKLIEIVKNE